ncbi:hypothetical protein BD560DRAFT_387492 [Blakeslea trispora]|nr:hypothetical protein BD560DRAFT_387492 [Blakeslea trispora]
MHFIFFVIAALAFVLNVNAAAILGKRASPDVQSCIVDLNQVSTQLDTLESTVANNGFMDVSKEYGQLQTNLGSAHNDCCAIHTVISDADADEFLASLGNLTPRVQKVLDAISSLRNNPNPLYRFVIRNSINSFDKSTADLNTCFTAFTPASRASTLQGYYNTIQTAFTSAKQTYDM